jgi:hypothetical protein
VGRILSLLRRIGRRFTPPGNREPLDDNYDSPNGPSSMDPTPGTAQNLPALRADR